MGAPENLMASDAEFTLQSEARHRSKLSASSGDWNTPKRQSKWARIRSSRVKPFLVVSSLWCPEVGLVDFVLGNHHDLSI